MREDAGGEQEARCMWQCSSSEKQRQVKAARQCSRCTNSGGNSGGSVIDSAAAAAAAAESGRHFFFEFLRGSSMC